MTPEATLVATLPAMAHCDEDPVEVSVRTKDLFESLRNAGGELIELTKLASSLRVKWSKGTCRLPIGQATLQFEEPPRHGPESYCQHTAEEFHRVLHSVTYWDVSEDDRPHTEVISIERSNGAVVEVTQCGAQLVNCTTIEVPTEVRIEPFSLSIMSARLLKKLAHSSKTVSWRTEGRDIEVHFDDCVSVYALGINIPRPNWRSVVPRGGFRWAKVRAEEFQEALRRASHFGKVPLALSINDEELGIRFLTETGVSSDESIQIESSTLFTTDILRLHSDTLCSAAQQYKRGDIIRIKIWGEGSPIMLEADSNSMQILAQLRF
jgi:DNA polymerase III sliding clamp (beta) subunit (PCNA family)